MAPKSILFLFLVSLLQFDTFVLYLLNFTDCFKEKEKLRMTKIYKRKGHRGKFFNFPFIVFDWQYSNGGLFLSKHF